MKEGATYHHPKGVKEKSPTIQKGNSHEGGRKRKWRPQGDGESTVTHLWAGAVLSCHPFGWWFFLLSFFWVAVLSLSPVFGGGAFPASFDVCNACCFKCVLHQQIKCAQHLKKYVKALEIKKLKNYRRNHEHVSTAEPNIALNTETIA